MNKYFWLRINILNGSPIFAMLVTCICVTLKVFFIRLRVEIVFELYIISLNVRDLNICDN